MDIQKYKIEQQYNRIYQKRKQQSQIKKDRKIKKYDTKSAPRAKYLHQTESQQKYNSLKKLRQIVRPCLSKNRTIQKQQNLISPIYHVLQKYNNQQKKNKLIEKEKEFEPQEFILMKKVKMSKRKQQFNKQKKQGHNYQMNRQKFNKEFLYFDSGKIKSQIKNQNQILNIQKKEIIIPKIDIRKQELNQRINQSNNVKQSSYFFNQNNNIKSNRRDKNSPKFCQSNKVVISKISDTKSPKFYSQEKINRKNQLIESPSLFKTKEKVINTDRVERSIGQNQRSNVKLLNEEQNSQSLRFSKISPEIFERQYRNYFESEKNNYNDQQKKHYLYINNRKERLINEKQQTISDDLLKNKEKNVNRIKEKINQNNIKKYKAKENQQRNHQNNSINHIINKNRQQMYNQQSYKRKGKNNQKMYQWRLQNINQKHIMKQQQKQKLKPQNQSIKDTLIKGRLNIDNEIGNDKSYKETQQFISPKFHDRKENSFDQFQQKEKPIDQYKREKLFARNYQKQQNQFENKKHKMNIADKSNVQIQKRRQNINRKKQEKNISYIENKLKKQKQERKQKNYSQMQYRKHRIYSNIEEINNPGFNYINHKIITENNQKNHQITFFKKEDKQKFFQIKPNFFENQVLIGKPISLRLPKINNNALYNLK